MKKKCTKCGFEKEGTEFSPGARYCKWCVNTIVKPLMAMKRGRRSRSWYRKPDLAKWSEKDIIMELDTWPWFWRETSTEQFQMYFDLCQSVGLRAREALYLTLGDFNFDERSVTIKTLKAPGNPKHDLWVRPDIAEKLRYVKGAPEERLFSFSYEQVRQEFKRVAAKLKLSVRLSPHSLRHLFGSRVMKASGNDLMKKLLLRHTPRDVTESYGRIPTEDRRACIEKTWDSQEFIWTWRCGWAGQGGWRDYKRLGIKPESEESGMRGPEGIKAKFRAHWIPDLVWWEFCERYGNKCLCCNRGGREVLLVPDHVSPPKDQSLLELKKGLWTIDNLQPLCKQCNHSKGHTTVDFRKNPNADRSWCAHNHSKGENQIP